MKNSNIRKYLVPSRPKTNVKFDVKAYDIPHDKVTPTDDPI